MIISQSTRAVTQLQVIPKVDTHILMTRSKFLYDSNPITDKNPISNIKRRVI